jgi:hypothetical protein
LYAEFTPVIDDLAVFSKFCNPFTSPTDLNDVLTLTPSLDTFSNAVTVFSISLFNLPKSVIDWDSPGILNSSAIYYVRALHSL